MKTVTKQTFNKKLYIIISLSSYYRREIIVTREIYYVDK